MFSRLSLKARVNLIIAAILTVVVATGSFVIIGHVRESVAEETRSTLQLVRELVAAIQPRTPPPDSQAQRWITLLERLSQTRHVRLYILRGEADLPGFPARPVETVPRWFTALVHPPPMHVEMRLPVAEGRVLRILLVADPGDEIAEAWEETQVSLGLIGLLAGASFAALTVILGRAFRPVDAVQAGLEALEQERYDHRLPDFPQPEWRRIARAFNHCAGVLAHTRAENRSLTRQLLKVEEDERRTLARELHDELGQVLSGIKMLALSIKKHQPAEPVHQAACLIADQVDHLSTLVRGMIHRLRPLMLDDLGLAAALDTLIAGWRQRRPDVTLALRCDPEIDRFPPEHRIHVYRIVQEALTNAFKHAHPGTIRVALSQETTDVPKRRWLRIHIDDDGTGAPPASCDRGYGLRGMRERVESLGGRLDIATAPGEGFSLTILLPFDEETEDDHPRHAG